MSHTAGFSLLSLNNWICLWLHRIESLTDRKTLGKHHKTTNEPFKQSTDGRQLAFHDVRIVHHVALAAVAVQPLAGARVVDDILRQAQADDETNQRLAAVVDGLMGGTAAGETEEIAGSRS